MAEIVSYHIENTIDELEQLQKYELYTSEEIKEIVSKRKSYEYRLQRIEHKGLADYMRYINYEQNLLYEIQSKISTNKIHVSVDTKALVWPHIRRIDALYRRTCFRYPSDVTLWITYIEFCLEQNWLGRISSIYSRMLQLNSDKPHLWIAAAKFEFEEHNSPETARALLHRALRLHPKNKFLWIELFRLELMYTEKIFKRREVFAANINQEKHENDGPKLEDLSIESSHETQDEPLYESPEDCIISGKLAQVVMQNAMETLDPNADSPEILSEFMTVLRTFTGDFASHISWIQESIISELRDRYEDNEQAWSLLIESGQSPHDKFAKKVATSIELFRIKVDDLNTQRIWTFYLSHLLKLLHSAPSQHDADKLVTFILIEMKRAASNNRLSSDMTLEWLLLLNSVASKNSQLESELKCLLYDEKLPNSANLTVAKCQIMFRRPSFSMEASHVNSTIKRSLTSLSCTDSELDSYIRVISLYLGWASQKLPTSVFERTLEQLCSGECNLLPAFENNLQLKRSLTRHIKDNSLDYLAKANATIERLRKFFAKVKDMQPMTSSLYKQMILREQEAFQKLSGKSDASEREKGLKRVRTLYENALIHFSGESAQLWLAYAHFELHVARNVSALSNIHFRASKALSADELQHFSRQYSILSTASSSSASPLSSCSYQAGVAAV